MNRDPSLSIGDVRLPLAGDPSSSSGSEPSSPGGVEDPGPPAAPAPETPVAAAVPVEAPVSSKAEDEEIRVWTAADDAAQAASVVPPVELGSAVPVVAESEGPAPGAFARLPAFLISSLLHICVIIALGLLMLPEVVHDTLTIIATTEVEEPVEELPEVVMPELEELDPAELARPLAGEPLGAVDSEMLAPGDISPSLEGMATDLNAIRDVDGLMRQIGGGGGGFGHGLGGDFGSRVAREGGQSGEVQVSLIWDDGNDLDLYVMAPSGEVIGYQNPRSDCGGQLDIDMNAGAAQSYEPVENIFWPFGQAPGGKYAVAVKYFARHDGPEVTRYKIAVKRGDKVTETEGEIRRSQGLKKVYEFGYRAPRR